MAYPLFLAKLLVRTGLARYLPEVRRLEGGADALRHVSDALLTAPLADLEAAGAALERQATEVLDLTQGSPRFDLLPSTGTRLPADRRGWPPVGGLPELRQAVADKLRDESGAHLHPGEEVLITAGVLGAVHTVLDAFVNPGDPVVLFDPCSPLYSLAARSHRARVRWLTSWVEEGRLRYREKDLARVLRRARLLVLNSPANPTGGILAAEDLERIAWWAQRHDVLILSDEVFERFRYGAEVARVNSMAPAARRTLTTGSVSKGHGLASARVGWLAGHRHLVRACHAAAALCSPFVPTLEQQVALAALRSGPEPFLPVEAEFESRRRFFCDRLRGMEFNPPWPEGAFFFWVPVWQLGLSGREFAARLLHEKNVRVTPGELFGPSGPGYVRLSFAGEDGRLQEGLNRLAEFVQELQETGRRAVRKAA